MLITFTYVIVSGPKYPWQVIIVQACFGIEILCRHTIPSSVTVARQSSVADLLLQRMVAQDRTGMLIPHADPSACLQSPSELSALSV